MKKLAQVTVELRHLLKTDFELFDFDYEFDDKKMAKELEQAVIDYFYFYEIGQETPEHFKHVFKRRWLSAISYYNKLHNTSLLEYNPLINYKMSEALEKLSQASTNTSSTSSEDVESSTTDHTEQNTSNRNTRTDDLKSTNITDEQASDYPQQPIAGGDYLAGARQIDTSTTNTGTVQDSGTSDTMVDTSTAGSATTAREEEQQATTNSNENYEKAIEGLTGKTYQELIQLERENILRISQMLIEELKPCFILVH